MKFPPGKSHTHIHTHPYGEDDILTTRLKYSSPFVVHTDSLYCLQKTVTGHYLTSLLSSPDSHISHSHSLNLLNFILIQDDYFIT